MLGKHLFGIYEKAFKPQESWKQCLQKARSLGFDFLEISIDEQEERFGRLFWSDEEIEALRRTTVEEKVPITSMCLSVHRRFPFGSADLEKRKMAYAIMERAIEFSQKMGIRVIQLAGYDVYYEPSTTESIKAFMDGMKWTAKCAARKQIMLAMEIMDTEFMNSIAKHMAYENEIQSPWYKVYPDLGNLTAWGNDVENELRLGIHSIVAVHVKDTVAVTQASEGVFKGVAFGKGCTDFVKCFCLLEKLGYIGPYVMEMWHVPCTNDVSQVAKEKTYIEQQFSMAMKKEGCT